MDDISYTLEWTAPLPLKIPRYRERIGRHLINSSLAHTSPQLKGHLDRFSRFAGLTMVRDSRTDRPTDDATPSVTIGLIYVRSTAMRPNKNVCMYVDMIIVVFCLVDYVLYLVVATYNGFPGAKVLRLAKLFRVIRSLRAVRILRTIRYSFTYSLCCRQVY